MKNDGIFILIFLLTFGMGSCSSGKSESEIDIRDCEQIRVKMADQGRSISVSVSAAPDARKNIWTDLDGNGKRDKGGKEDVKEFDKYVEYFPVEGLEYLGFCGEITKLECSDNNFVEIFVVNNRSIEYLDCSRNELRNMDIKAAVKLDTLLCSRNKLKTVDFSQNLRLSYIECYLNTISGKDMRDLIESLPDRKGEKSGIIVAIDFGNKSEYNVVRKSDVLQADARNWKIYALGHSNPFEGVDD